MRDSLVSRLRRPCFGVCQPPEDVAEYAAFAASDRARTMTGVIANLTAGSIVE
jgi:hypothetical protein